MLFQNPEGGANTHRVSLETRYPLPILHKEEDSHVIYGTRYLQILSNKNIVARGKRRVGPIPDTSNQTS